MTQQLFGPNGFIHAEDREDCAVHIMWAGNLYYTFNRSDTFAKNVGISLLASIGLIRKDIQRLFHVSRSTIKRIVAIVKKHGLEGLKDYHQGPPVMRRQIIDFVISLYQQLEGTRGYQSKILKAIDDKRKNRDFNRTISRQTLHSIIRDYRRERERKQKEIEEKERREEEAKKDKEKQEEEERHIASMQPELGGRDESESMIVDHGGSIATAVFVNELGSFNMIPEGLTEKDNRYTNRELAFAYVATNAAKLVTVEQNMEIVGSYKTGGILGRERLPSLSLYRSRIPALVEHMDMEEVIRETAKLGLQVMKFSPVVYVDGHFVPYYGEAKILGGYSSQRRMVMEGREYFWVHDENGVPIYAALSCGYRKMRYYLECIDKDLRRIYGAKQRELLEVFDRGGYGKEFCVGITDEIRFICWKSDSKGVPAQAIWQEVDVERGGNEWGETKIERMYAWEREVVYEACGKRKKFREIWIRKGNKISPAITNDDKMPLGEVVRKLVRRWGAQENGFKKLKEHGIDRIHSYRKEGYDPEYLYANCLEDREEGIRREVDNPLIKEVSKKIVKIRADVSKMKEKLSHSSKKVIDIKIKRKIRYLESRLAHMEEERAKLPKKVLLYDIIKDNGIERIKKEKKLFFDWLKIIALWSRKVIVDIVKPYWKDMRDVEKFVDSILRSRTYVRIVGEIAYVNFPVQLSKRRLTALEHLCKELNKKGEINIGIRIRKLIFSISKFY